MKGTEAEYVILKQKHAAENKLKELMRTYYHLLPVLKSALKSEHLKEFSLIGNLTQPDYYLAGERKIRKLPELIFMYRINNSLSSKRSLDAVSDCEGSDD